MATGSAQNSLWYAPFNARGPQPLQSVYDPPPAATDIAEAATFTVSLETAMVGRRPPPDLLDAILHRRRDILISSEAFLGNKPPTQRVHLYDHQVPTDEPVKEFLASTMFVCEDYKRERLWLDVKIVEARSSDRRDDAVKAFQAMAASAGAVFPVTLPYTAFASTLSKTVDSVADAIESKPLMVLSRPIELFASGSVNCAQLQLGRYVAFPEDVDGSSFQLGVNGVLIATSGARVELPYVVVRVDSGQQVTPEMVVSQRIATLLTGLQSGNQSDPAATSLKFLQETLTAYSNFKDLKRYTELKAKRPGALTKAEKELMARFEAREDLQPFLPK
jgi:hypothetical protein